MNHLARPLTMLSALLVCAGLAAGTAARAGEEPPVVRALLDSAALSSAVRPTYGNLEVAADGTITLRDLKQTMQGEDGADAAMSYDIASLVLADVKELGEGMFEIGGAEWSNLTVTLGESPLAAIPLITAKSIYVTQPAEEPSLIERMRASHVLAEEMLIPEAVMVIAGQSLMIEDLTTSWQGDPLSSAGTTEFLARRIHVAIPAALLEDQASPLAGSGYSKLEFALSGTTTTTYSDDLFGFDLETRLDGRDIGSLIIDLGADGIPLALFAAMNGAEPDPDELLPIAQGVSLKRARIRFEDGSLTGRLLSMMAEAEDMDVEEFVADITEGIAIGLQDVLDQRIAQQVSDSLTAFLKDPKAITFSMTPKMPVSLEQIMAGLEDPMALIELLQLNISAND